MDVSKEFSLVQKEINRLINKQMSNINLIVTIEKSLKVFKTRKFKKFVFRLFSGELQPTQIWLNFQTSCCKLNQRSGSICDLFDFDRNYNELKSKSPCFL